MLNMNRRRSKRVIGVALILVSMLIVLAYSTTGNPPSANAVAPLQPSKPEAVNLKHATTGTAQLVWDATLKTLTVTINMSGLAPNSTTYPADIDQGTCAAPGTLVATLSPITPKAGANPSTPGQSARSPKVSVLNPQVGTNTPTPPAGGRRGGDSSKTTISSTTVPQLATQLPKGIPASGWIIEIHNGPTLTVDKTSIACGDITNLNTWTTTNQFVDVSLGPTKDLNQAANGVATFSIANNQLTVTIAMSGLAPSSKHLAHIHSGSCRDQGAPVYPLSDVIADKNGNAISITKLNVASIPKGWYVNVHLTDTQAGLNTQTGYDSLVCGDVHAQ